MGAAKITKDFRWPQVAAFRLARHHLIDRTGKSLRDLCRDVCGIQAQVMSSAELACWTRTASVSRDAVHSALWKDRTLVRTSCMRQTLHLLPAADFSIYIIALRRSRMAALLRGMARFGMTVKDLDGLNAMVVDALSSGPMSQRDLAQAIKLKANPRVVAWAERFWSVVRPAVVEGLVCYAPDQAESGAKRGNAVFVRTDQWLPKQKKIDELEAQRFLLRGFLRAYGPATVQDFAFWSGISVKESRDIWNSLADEITEVSIEGEKRAILNHDLEVFAGNSLPQDVVRLLPGFDPFLLAHAEKGHMVQDEHYKLVYRNQGWISPVVLVNGRIAGTWSCAKKGRGLSFKAELFEKISKSQRSKIHNEAESLGDFLGGTMAIDV